MGRTKKTADQKEYEKLTAELATLRAKYNAEPNFIQKNTIHLQLQKLSGRVKELESKVGQHHPSGGNYQSELKSLK